MQNVIVTGDTTGTSATTSPDNQEAKRATKRDLFH